jgi:hypothetical protein
MIVCWNREGTNAYAHWRRRMLSYAQRLPLSSGRLKNFSFVLSNWKPWSLVARRKWMTMMTFRLPRPDLEHQRSNNALPHPSVVPHRAKRMSPIRYITLFAPAPIAVIPCVAEKRWCASSKTFLFPRRSLRNRRLNVGSVRTAGKHGAPFRFPLNAAPLDRIGRYPIS